MVHISFQLEIPELQAFHGKIELGPEIIIMALQHYVALNINQEKSLSPTIYREEFELRMFTQKVLN